MEIKTNLDKITKNQETFIKKKQSELKNWKSLVSTITKKFAKLEDFQQKKAAFLINSSKTSSDLKRWINQIDDLLVKNKKNKKECLKMLKENQNIKAEIIKLIKSEDDIDLSNFQKVVELVSKNKIELEKKKKEQEKLKEENSFLKKLEKTKLNLDLKSFDSLDDAKSYFLENGYDYFELGSDYYYDSAFDSCIIQDRLFDVTIIADVLKNKADHGTYYYVDNIEKVELKHISDDEYKERANLKLEEEIKRKQQELDNLLNKKKL